MRLSFGGRSYRYLFFLVVASVVLQIVSDATAGKIVALAGVSVSVSTFYFPLTFVISDILTEVYGFASARRTLWVVMAASVAAGLIFKMAALMPSPDFFDAHAAYARVFGIMPRILGAGWLAVFAGESANNMVMAFMKTATRGRWLWTRTVGSTLVGQGVNSILFYGLGLSGLMPWEALCRAALAAWGLKVVVESLCTPFVYRLVSFLKKAEHEDPFDTARALNPFLF